MNTASQHHPFPFPGLTVLVVGDFFLDKYLIIEHALAETSLETGLEAHQVVGGTFLEIFLDGANQTVDGVVARHDVDPQAVVVCGWRR